MAFHAFLVIVQVILVLPIWAQTTWVNGQVNTSICVWERPRAALLRDTIYLDGGNLRWSPGFENGTYGMPTDSGNPQGLVLTFNLSNAFSSTTNITNLLVQNPAPKARGGIGFADGSAPNYVDGALLANDAEFFLYGGVPDQIDGQNALPGEHSILGFQKYQYGPPKETFTEGFHDLSLPSNVSQYIAYGGAANAPSENKAWYFSGLASASHGPIYAAFNATTRAANVSNTLISVDMSQQLFENWNNQSLSNKHVKGRANPELVWVPVGKQGILVVLGGVVFPDWITATGNSEDRNASQQQSPEFMRTIDIYDVAGDTWYQQPTKGGPGALTRGCAVVAPASDSSSFNIYYYGGYNGIDQEKPFSDQVWVLSLPSFTWTLLNNGTDAHARAGHQCFLPYPDQMMIFGGYTPVTGVGASCLDKGPVVLFNVSSGEWMDAYDPTKYSDYGVPENIQNVIGGNAAGGATATKPAPSGWATTALGNVFATTYDQSKITKYWPYPAIQTNSSQTGPDQNHRGGGGLPSWVGPVLGVVLGLILVTGLIIFFCLWRRRKILKRHSSDSGRTEDAGLRILAWIRGETPSHKAGTVATTEDTSSSPDMREATVSAFTPPTDMSVSPPPLEMDDTQVAELEGEPVRAELHDTGLIRVDLHQRNSSGFQGGSPSESDISFSPYPLSTVSTSTRDIYPGTPRVDSPPLGVAYPVSSDSHPPPVPDIPKDEEKTLQSIPEIPNEAVSPNGAEARKSFEGVKAIPIPPNNAVSPPSEVVSPPTGDEIQGEDYLSAKKSDLVSPTSRNSVLEEKKEDVGKSD